MGKRARNIHAKEAEDDFDLDAELCELVQDEAELMSAEEQIESDFEGDDIVEAEEDVASVSKASMTEAVALLTELAKSGGEASSRHHRALCAVLGAFRVHAHLEEHEETDFEVLEIAHKFLVSPGATNAFYAVLGCPVSPTHKGRLPAIATVSRMRQPKYARLPRSLVGNLLQFLKMPLTESNAAAVRVTLVGLANLAPVVAGGRASRVSQLVDRVVEIWGESGAKTATAAISALAAMSTAPGVPSAIVTYILRSAYRRHVAALRAVNEHTWPILDLQRGHLSVLFRSVPDLGYGVGFRLVQHLGLYLRKALLGDKPSKKAPRGKQAQRSLKAVVTWRFVGAVALWQRIVLESVSGCRSGASGALLPAPKEEADQPFMDLVFPVMQLLSGLSRVAPATAVYAPLRVHACRMLFELAEAADLYVPVSATLLELLNGLDLTVARPSDACLEVTHALRASPGTLAKKEYVASAFVTALRTLCDALIAISHLAAFPEIARPVGKELRALVKRFSTPAQVSQRASGATKLLKRLAKAIDASASSVQAKRDALSVAPTAVEAVAAWEESQKASKGTTALAALAKDLVIGGEGLIVDALGEARAPTAAAGSEDTIMARFARTAAEEDAEDMSSDLSDSEEEESEEEGPAVVAKVMTAEERRLQDEKFGKDVVEALEWSDDE